MMMRNMWTRLLVPLRNLPICITTSLLTAIKNAKALNRNTQLTEKRYAAMMKLMQAKKSKTIEQPPIPQTTKTLPRFIFLTHPLYWIKRMYRSKHFRQFLIVCMACLFAVSVFLTIFLAYDNAQLRRF